MAYRKSELSGLKAEIKRLADEGRSWNARIQAARGPERHAARLEKAGVGHLARTALLAYALLREVPYTALERRTRDGSPGGWMQSCIAGIVRKHRPEPMTEEESETAVHDWVSAQYAEAAQ